MLTGYVVQHRLSFPGVFEAHDERQLPLLEVSVAPQIVALGGCLGDNQTQGVLGLLLQPFQDLAGFFSLSDEQIRGVLYLFTHRLFPFSRILAGTAWLSGKVPLPTAGRPSAPPRRRRVGCI